MLNRSGCNSGVNASVMGHWGCDNRRRAMAYGLSQHVLMAGLGLKVVGSIERDPDLMAMSAPIGVVGTPVKSHGIEGTIILNQPLFDKVTSIELCCRVCHQRDWRSGNQIGCKGCQRRVLG